MPDSAATRSHTTTLLAALRHELPAELAARVVTGEPMSLHTTLRVGGPADAFLRVVSGDELAVVAATVQRLGPPWFLLGGGSNICVSDTGIRGLVVENAARACTVGVLTRVETGHSLMRLSQKSLSAGLSGLEFAVGIPGTVGGALVSNAGAYRQNIAEVVAGLDVVECGRRAEVEPDWMEFSYRDSRLRRGERLPAAVIGVTLRLRPAPRRHILARARENQRQRIFKQPWFASAGSFFKNVNDKALADSLPGLPASMRAAGVVPAGYLSGACGCKGLRIGAAEASSQHANIFVNRGGATAADVRHLADAVKKRVRERFGVELQEEVLYVGDWGAWNGGA